MLDKIKQFSLKNITAVIASVLFIVFIAGLQLFSPWQVIIALLFPIVLMTTAIYPHWGVYLLAFFLPTTSWYFYFGKLEIPFVDLLGLFLLVSFISRLLYLWSVNYQQFKKEFHWPILVPYLVFLGISFLSALQVDTPMDSIWYTVRWIVIFYIIYIFLPFNIIKEKKHLKGVIVSLILSALAVSAIGLASLPQQDFYNEFVRIKPISIFGIYPIEQNQKHISETIVSILFLLFTLPFLLKNKLSKKLIYGLFIFFCLVVLGSFARTAWLVLILQLLLFGWYMVKRNKIQLQHFLMTVILFFIIMLPATYYMAVLQSSPLSVGSTESRILMTQIGGQAFLGKPFLGQGAGHFEELIQDNIYFIAKYGRFLDAHGLIQKISTELGILGLVAFGWIIGNIFYKLTFLFNRLKERIVEQEILFYIMLSAGGILLFEFFDTFYYKGKLWFIIALSLVAIKLIKEKKLVDFVK